MVHSRFESDLAEIADEGHVLVMCAGRKKVFLEGDEVVQLDLADVAVVEAGEAALVLRLADGAARTSALPTASTDEIAALAARLDACARAWR